MNDNNNNSMSKVKYDAATNARIRLFRNVAVLPHVKFSLFLLGFLYKDQADLENKNSLDIYKYI